MPFLTELVSKPAGRGLVELTEPLDYLTPHGFLIRIPIGFVSDLASIPWFMTWLFKKNGNHREEAVFHDYLYAHGGYYYKQDSLVEQDRARCDWRFYIALLESGDMPTWKCNAMYKAVEMFGGWAWRKHRAKEKRMVP